MEIVKATINDKPEILAIARSYRDTKAFGAPWYSDAKIFATDVYVAKDEDGSIVGFYSAHFNKRFKHVTLMFIAVRLDRMKRGVGRMLVTHLQNRVVLSKTHFKIRAKIERDNPAALAFFQKMQFKGVNLEGNSAYSEWRQS